MSITTIDMAVTRGSRLDHVCVLRQGFPEIVQNPALFRGRLVFRELQDDDVPEIFAVSATPEVALDPECGSNTVTLAFTVAGSLTQILPSYDIVGFVEVVETGVDTQRLYNLRVRTGD